MARQYKVNKVTVDIAGYMHYWRGVKKIGKTTLFRDLLISKYGSPEYGLLLSMGNEDGYKALPDIVYEVIEDWDTLTDVVDDLVENKKDNNFKFVAFDTVDEWTTLAEKEVIRLDKKKTGTVHTFNACFGGYGEPRKQLGNLINDVLTKLKRAGYGIICIGHTRIRDIKEKNGDAYQQLTSNLSSDYDSIFADKADIVMLGENVKTIKDKQIEAVDRIMHFRSDGWVDAGSRFDTIVDHCEWSAENYIKAVEDAIKAKLNCSDKEYEHKVAEEVKAKEESYEENKTKLTTTPDKVVESIKDLLSKLSPDNKKIGVSQLIKLGIDAKDLPNNDLSKLIELETYLKQLTEK